MELRQYWTIIRRRWIWVLAPALLVLALGLLTYRPAPASYNTGVRFIVAQQPGVAAEEFDEQRYFNWTTSEYIVNGLGDWVRGGSFATAVSRGFAACLICHCGGRGRARPGWAGRCWRSICTRRCVTRRMWLSWGSRCWVRFRRGKRRDLTGLLRPVRSGSEIRHGN